MTVDLDVLVRSRLLAFLVEECEERGATVLYATHIFDGLDTFPTHLCHIQLGTTLPPSPLSWPIVYNTPHVDAAGKPSTEVIPGIPQGVREKMENPMRAGSRLLELCLAWLKEDRVKRVDLEVEMTGERKRGARALPADSEQFYRKSVFSFVLSQRVDDLTDTGTTGTTTVTRYYHYSSSRVDSVLYKKTISPHRTVLFAAIPPSFNSSIIPSRGDLQASDVGKARIDFEIINALSIISSHSIPYTMYAFLRPSAIHDTRPRSNAITCFASWPSSQRFAH